MFSLGVEKDENRLGAFKLGEGLTPVDIWQSLHAAELLWVASGGAQGATENQPSIDETDLSLLKKLVNFPAKRWAQMCDGIGWTPLGAAAMTWCKGSKEPAFKTAWSIAVPEQELSHSQKRALKLAKVHD